MHRNALGACSVEVLRLRSIKCNVQEKMVNVQIKDDLFDYGKQRIGKPQESIYMNVKNFANLYHNRQIHQNEDS